MSKPWKAWGVISDHEKEYMVPGDRGVGMYRSRIKKYCMNLAKGKTTATAR